MFDIKMFENMSLNEKYDNMLLMLEGLISDENDKEITKLSNASAVINALVDNNNWCGFYIRKGNKLLLGPFQGMPACTKIEIGKGVCGLCAKKKETILVSDVHNFEGHIACDAASNSEIVIPILKDNELVALLDIDSAQLSRFTETEKEYLEKAANLLAKYINWDIVQNYYC